MHKFFEQKCFCSHSPKHGKPRQLNSWYLLVQLLSTSYCLRQEGTYRAIILDSILAIVLQYSRYSAKISFFREKKHSRYRVPVVPAFRALFLQTILNHSYQSSHHYFFNQNKITFFSQGLNYSTTSNRVHSHSYNLNLNVYSNYIEWQLLLYFEGVRSYRGGY